MSSMKYQLKELISTLSLEANKNRDPEIKRRFYLIKAVVESKKDVKKTCESRGVSTDQFYMWAKRLLKDKSILSLKSRSRSAKSFWNETAKHVIKKIILVRKQEPFKGPDRISYDLQKRFNIKCAVSTVAAILKRAGLVTKSYRDRLTKKHLKRYRRAYPGYMQMDFKYTPYLLEGRQTYQLSAVDHHSSWRFIRSYSNRRTETVLEFLDALEAAAPFGIVELQTDNAMEFTDKYTSHQRGMELVATGSHAVDIWCGRRGIRHKLIPIGQKEINGKVENTHKWDDREFFSQICVKTFTELELATTFYNRQWNEDRPTKTLGWRTPLEVVYDASVRAYFELQLVLVTSRFKPQGQLKTITIGQASVTASRSELAQVRKKMKTERTQQKTQLDRYLQYLEWDDKKFKSLIPLPMILQKFSKGKLSS